VDHRLLLAVLVCVVDIEACPLHDELCTHVSTHVSYDTLFVQSLSYLNNFHLQRVRAIDVAQKIKRLLNALCLLGLPHRHACVDLSHLGEQVSPVERPNYKEEHIADTLNTTEDCYGPKTLTA